MDFHRLTREVVQLVNDLLKKIAKIRQALGITCKWVYLANDLSQKIPKLPKDLEQNVNWNQTLLNEITRVTRHKNFCETRYGTSN